MKPKLSACAALLVASACGAGPASGEDLLDRTARETIHALQNAVDELRADERFMDWRTPIQTKINKQEQRIATLEARIASAKASREKQAQLAKIVDEVEVLEEEGESMRLTGLGKEIADLGAENARLTAEIEDLVQEVAKLKEKLRRQEETAPAANAGT